MKKKILKILAVVFLLLLATVTYLIYWSNTHTKDKGLKGIIAYLSGNKNALQVDDWSYNNLNHMEIGTSNFAMDVSGAGAGSSFGGIFSGFNGSGSGSSAVNSSSTIGLSTGGAKNIENFRNNIKNGYFPISTDITYNGLFYDYYFDTGNTSSVKNKDDLFYPTYSTAVSNDPVSKEAEYFMTVGLNSNIKESDFSRKKLNLVIVLDISGSMSSGFNSYFYDGNSNDKEDYKSKMQIANESVNMLLDELKPEDKVGIVLFDDNAYVAKKMNAIEETDIEAIKNHVLSIEAQGGTNFDAGYTQGTKLFDDDMLEDPDYENRIIVITDAMPNMGNTSRDYLTEDIRKNADKGIYTSFIGVGVDFNTAVIETLSDVKGANYYSIHSSKEFHKIMSEDFEFMVTPLVFDLELKFDSDNFEIQNVYGTDTKDKSSGTIMKVNTLFPSSKNEDGEAKGGIILLKLKANDNKLENDDAKIIVSYKDREGKEHRNEQNVSFKNKKQEYYDNTGIRKGIVLTRYANLMKNWILYERGEEDRTFIINTKTGIKDCDYTTEQIRVMLGENERSSVKLTVSEKYKDNFEEFKKYFENEVKEIGDEEMKQEIEVLDFLIKK